MKKYSIFTIALLFTNLGFASDIEHLNLKSMYEGAKEVEMLNKAMESGMREHNIRAEPILVESTEAIMENSPIQEFEERENQYYLERTIEDSKQTKVSVSINGNMIKIETKTTKKEHTSLPNGISESTFNSSSTEELSLPYDADMRALKKEYKDGILKIFIPKRGHFKATN